MKQSNKLDRQAQWTTECPECKSSPLQQSSGCVVCLHCGWAACG